MERGRLLHKLSESILAHHDELTHLEMRDCGKPVKQAKADTTAVARYFEYYAGACDKLHGDTIPYTPGFAVMTFYEPHGVTGHIIPWNYPMQIFGRSIRGALAAGNACVVKPAEDACLSLLRIAELAAQCGFPEDALNIVTGYGHEAGQALADAVGIDHISFAGSARVGTIIAQSATKPRVPAAMDLDVGPLIRANQLERVNGFLARSGDSKPTNDHARKHRGRSRRNRFLRKANIDRRCTHRRKTGPGRSLRPRPRCHAVQG